MSDEETKVEDTTPVVEPTPEPTPEEAAVAADTSVTEAREAAAAEEVIPTEAEAVEVTVVEMPHRDLRSGMFVRMHERIKDVNSKGEERQRTQVFEGLVLGVRGPGISRTVTVRKNAKGWMVEKIFPLSSPNLEKVEVVKTYRSRRAKLSYLRGDFKRKLKEVKVKKVVAK
jgi:large subunit ribosomal protein L19